MQRRNDNILSKDIGKAVENWACDYLVAQGLNYVIANYYCRFGEIDLIMKDGDVIVFVEVRYRRNTDYGDPLVTITRTKQKKIIKAALYYLQKTQLLDKVSCRFDVVTVTQDEMKVSWIKDAFWCKW